MLALVPEEPEWDVPHRVLAAIDYLVLRGEAAYDGPESLVAAVREHGAFVERFVREHTTQTNVVQRCWALLPLFLTVAREAGRPLDLLELGASAGLDLAWDRYRYEYAAGSWGPPDSPFVLRGEERAPFPPELLDVEVEVRRRRGVDLRPLDVSDEEDLRLLLAFSPSDPYRRNVGAAAEVVRADPPELVRGDYVELLPELLADREPGAMTVVFQTISTIYLPLERRLRVREILERAGVAWISTPSPEEHGLRGRQYPLELNGRLVAEMDNGGEWLDWWG